MENTSISKRRQHKPRERNNILRKYYGIQERNAADIQPQEDIRPFDIDGNTFDASKYFASLLKNKNLKELIEQDNQLVGAPVEIREIDGDMKTLVYENYSKFISATDTIRRMKSNVENMESEMARLSDNVAQISIQSKTIHQELSGDRKKIQQLSNIHNSLKRLQFVFDLPNRLQYCLNKKNHTQAVKYYSKASKLLNHYQHMAAFKGIERDCAQIMEKVKTDIWAHLTDPEATLEVVAEETKLLLTLGQDPQELQKKYLDLQLSGLDKKVPSLVDLSASELMLVYIQPLEDIVHHFERLFLPDDDGDTNQLQDKQEIKHDLLMAISPYLDRLFDTVTYRVQLRQEVLSDVSFRQSGYLLELKSGIQTSAMSLASITNLVDRIDNLIADREKNLIKRALDTCLPRFQDRIHKFMSAWQSSHENDASEFDADQLTHFIEQTQLWIADDLEKSCLLPLKDYLDLQHQSTVDRVQNGIKYIWTKIAQQLKTIGTDINLNRPSLQMLVLIASRLCYDLADSNIFQLYSAFSFHFCKQPEQGSKSHLMDPRVIPDLNDNIDHMLNTGQDLINKYMMQEGYELATKIQEAYLYSAFTKPVCQISEVWYLTFNRLKHTEKLVDIIYSEHRHTPFSKTEEDSVANDNGPYSHHHNHHQLLSTHSLATAASSSLSETPTRQHMGYNDMTLNIMNNIDKLFAERVDIYRKAFLEATREMQMNTIAYQQIQVDIEFARRITWPYIGDEKWATTMLQEILSNSYTRCSSPINLSQDEMALILSQ
ncbi:Vps51/Vps67-domain-containing protein [Blakeslea trispora]|nr:Vps51/Vps67-domain-containing protein [Blakeslea trispora]